MLTRAIGRAGADRRQALSRFTYSSAAGVVWNWTRCPPRSVLPRMSAWSTIDALAVRHKATPNTRSFLFQVICYPQWPAIWRSNSISDCFLESMVFVAPAHKAVSASGCGRKSLLILRESVSRRLAKRFVCALDSCETWACRSIWVQSAFSFTLGWSFPVERTNTEHYVLSVEKVLCRRRGLSVGSRVPLTAKADRF